MDIESRIIQWQELSKKHKSVIQDLDAYRQESNRREEEKRKVERIHQFIQQVPLRFREKTFIDFKIDHSHQALVKNLAQRYVQTFNERLKEGSSIRFIGNPGTGKTLLSLIMYQALAKEGYSVKYESSLEFIKNLLEIKFKSQSQFQSHLEKYQEVQLLVLDEVTESINQHGPSEIERQLLFKMIDRRYENKLCTLMITNRNHQALVNRLGKPSIDRLNENGISLAFNWDSYR